MMNSNTGQHYGSGPVFEAALCRRDAALRYRFDCGLSVISPGADNRPLVKINRTSKECPQRAVGTSPTETMRM